MELTDSFEVARPIEETWQLLTDVERVVPCLPGAHLHEIEGDEYRGVVRVRIGRLNTQYSGAAIFRELNRTDHKLVFTGQGKDGGDGGSAEAVVTVKLEPLSDTSTGVNVDTDLTLSGRVAQMSGGVIGEVSATLIRQFAENLASMLDGDNGVRATVADGTRSERRRVDMPEPEAIDLMDAARTPVLKRLGAAVAFAGLIWWLRRRRR